MTDRSSTDGLLGKEKHCWEAVGNKNNECIDWARVCQLMSAELSSWNTPGACQCPSKRNCHTCPWKRMWNYRGQGYQLAIANTIPEILKSFKFSTRLLRISTTFVKDYTLHMFADIHVTACNNVCAFPLSKQILVESACAAWGRIFSEGRDGHRQHASQTTSTGGRDVGTHSTTLGKMWFLRAREQHHLVKIESHPYKRHKGADCSFVYRRRREREQEKAY